MNEVLNNMSYNGYTIDFLKELVTISFDEYVQRNGSAIQEMLKTGCIIAE